MIKKVILWVGIIALLFVVGCNSDKGHPSSSSSSIAQEIPFVIFLQNTGEQASVSTDSGYICYFNTASGKVSIDATPLFKRIIQGENFFRMIWDGEKNIVISAMPFGGSPRLESLNPDYNIKELNPADAKLGEVIKNTGGSAKVYNENSKVIVEFASGKKQVLTPPLPPGAMQEALPLLISGDEHNYRVLITFDVPSSEEKDGRAAGKLLIAEVKEGSIKWKEVRGEYCSFIAGAGSHVAQIGKEVYITGCGGNVMVLNLQKDSPALENYKPVTDLLTTLKGKFFEGPIKPSFGVYKNCLMVTVQNSDEKWLWFLRNGVYLGEVHINELKNQIESNLGGKEIETKKLPSKASIDLPQLPVDGYGAWQ